MTHTLRAEGFDASEDGTGRGTPLVIEGDSAASTPQLPRLRSGCGRGGETAVVFDTTQVTSPGNYSEPKPGDPCHPLAAGQHPPAVAYQQHGSDVGKMGTLRAGKGDVQSGVPFMPSGITVRRLTPREAERLQGFPDDWTKWDADGSELKDGPRYRMLGNAVAVPVAEWIAKRIVEMKEDGEVA